MKVYELAKEVDSYVVSMRRHFHENPELSNQEEATLARVKQELDGMGIPYEEIPYGGLLGFIEGTKPGKGKTVLLRADCDALPVKETKNNLAGPRVCCSKVDGVMHACGHDGHMAMLLGAAKILSAHKDEIAGKIILLFERSEEIGPGINYCLAYMDKHGITADTVWGVHLYNALEAGKVAINTGNTMSTAMGFNVTIHGKGGHGSRPDQANSPIDCFVAIYNALQASRLTKVSPFEPLNLSVGVLNSGLQGNVIPNDLTFGGTIRLFNRDLVGIPYHAEFRRMVEGIAASYDCTVTFNTLSQAGFPVYNDPTCAEFARKVIAEEVGDNAEICQVEPWMASESFSFLQQWVPGVFALIGIKNDEKGTGALHHNEYFDLDEDALKLGVTGAVTYAIKFLESDIDVSDKKFKGSTRDLLATRAADEETLNKYYNGTK